MSEINCYIPIKLRITGRPSDSQLDQLGDALVRALAARMEFAERVIGNGHSFTTVGAADLREPFLSHRYYPEDATYAIPSYNGGGAQKKTTVKKATSKGGARVAPIWQSAVFTNEAAAEMIRKYRSDATQSGLGNSGVYYGAYFTMEGTNGPLLYYLIPGLQGDEWGTIFLYRRFPDLGKVADALMPGNYTVLFRPHGMGHLYRGPELLYSLENPHNLDVTVNFLVPGAPNSYNVPPREPLAYHFYPRLSVLRMSDEARLTTDADTVYLADVEIWRVDENGNWNLVPALTLGYFFIFYEWKVWHIKKASNGEPAQRVRVELLYPNEPSLTLRWNSAGDYEIQCSVKLNFKDASPLPVTDKRHDTVVPLLAKMTLELAYLTKQDREGGAKRIWFGSANALWEDARARLRKAEGDPKVSEAARDMLNEAFNELEQHLYNQTTQGPFPLRAIFTERRTGRTIPITIFIGPAITTEEGYAHTWKLIDLTYQGAYRTFTGNGQTVEEAIREAFEDGRTSIKANYPPGIILVRVEWPTMSNYGLSPFDLSTPTESLQREAWEWFTLTASLVGVVGLAATMVIPEMPTLISVIIISGAVAGAAVSVVNIIERINTNSFKWDREVAVDLLNIAGAFTSVGGGIARATARATSREFEALLAAGRQCALAKADKAGKIIGYQRSILYMELANMAANGVLIAHETYTELRNVSALMTEETLAAYQRKYGDKGQEIWENERLLRVMSALARAAANGWLTWVSIRDTMKTLREAQETLKQLERLEAIRTALESSPKGISKAAAGGLEKAFGFLRNNPNAGSFSVIEQLRPGQAHTFMEVLNGLDESSISRALESRLEVFRRVVELSPNGMSSTASKGLDKFLGALRADLSNEVALSLLNHLSQNQLPQFLETLNELDESSVIRNFKRLSNSSASEARERLHLLLETRPEREGFAKSLARIKRDRGEIIKERQKFTEERPSEEENPVLHRLRTATEKNPFIDKENNVETHLKGIKKMGDKLLDDEEIMKRRLELSGVPEVINLPYWRQNKDPKKKHITFHVFGRIGAKKNDWKVPVYLNVKADRALEVMEFVVHEIVHNPGKFPGIIEAKIGGGQVVNERVDNLVIYAENQAAADKVVNSILAKYEANHDNIFQKETMPMTKRIANGVSIGMRPNQRPNEKEISSSQARANVILNEVLKEETKAMTDEQFLERVKKAFADAGIDPDLLYLNLPPDKPRTKSP